MPEAIGGMGAPRMDSFFTVSKVAWFVAAPSNALVIVLVLAALLLLVGARRIGGLLLGLSVLGVLVLGFSPAANYIMSPLEERFPQFHDDGKPVTGVLLLGGAELPDIGLARGQPAFSEAGERVLAFVDLSRRYPQARLAFIGGSGALLPAGHGREAEMMRQSLGPLGIDPARMEFEDKSRNTVENAEFAKALLKPQPGERWLLVTSAFHMPRAMGCFRAVDFPVVAYPVDFRTVGPKGLNGTFSRAASGLDFTDVGVKEWVGLVAYYLGGKTLTLFPGP
ncbi:YdcF family protein [Xanthobacter agilis]|uniref:YdcF family protein n=2 Tax=Xanthobacter agilis TaxID=47492 RepID=UPI0037273F5D